MSQMETQTSPENLTVEESNRLIADWNSTEADYPRTKCIHQVFEEQVGKRPEAVAVHFNDKKLTYDELNQRANQIAKKLCRFKVGPEVLVGIFVERSAEMVASLLAILKTGAAYVPLDPEYPAERLAYMISDAAMPVILTQKSLEASLPKTAAQILLLDEINHAAERIEDVSSSGTSENLAYVIYTSGSTGKPKGVQIIHRGVVNLLTALERIFQVTHGDNLLAVTTVSFDMSVNEIFLPLIAGGQVTIASRAVAMNGAQLAELIKSSRPTLMQATPPTWRLLVEAGWEKNDQLTIITGGEALDRHLAKELLDRTKAVWNLYGPTEITVYATAEQISLGNDRIAIGRPLTNTQIHILDEALQPVPVGATGELHIGGDGLSRGYLNRPELTAEKFIPNPFDPTQGSRLYKSGDLARFENNGRIQCLGRIDHQVKIRGYRIELGEIESVLQKIPSIQEAIVLAREDTPGDKKLVAYLRTPDGSAPAASELRGVLQKVLPDYMLPNAYVALRVFPLTPSGKVDRKSLPAPQQPVSRTSSHEAPSTPLEIDLAAIWRDVFHIADVGVNDHFLDLGGHSLTAVKIVVRVQDRIGVELPPQTLFETLTIGALAELIMQKLLDVESNDEIASLLKNLDQMSDEEARHLLVT